MLNTINNKVNISNTSIYYFFEINKGNNINPFTEEKNVLALTHPHLIEEWDFKANIGLNPYMLSYGSNKRAIWKCKECGNVWETIIANRTKGSGCPICNKKKCGRKGKKEILSTARPDLLKEWDYTKNNQNNIYPDKITSGSGKYASWICSECSCKWESKINDRVRGYGCPNSKIHKLLKLQKEENTVKEVNNSVAKTNPFLLKEWNYSKNSENGLYPEMIKRGSHKKVSWICSKCSHEWITEVRSRTCMKSGCPVCGRK